MIDTMFIPILVIFIILIACVGIFILHEVSNAFVNANVNPDYFSNLSGLDTGATYFIYAVYFGLPVVGIILAFYSGRNILFAIASVGLLAINLFVFGILKDVFVRLLPSLGAAYTLFSNNAILSSLIEYYPFIMFVFGAIAIAAQFLFD